MRISRLSVDRPVTVLMGVCVLLVLGLMSFSRLPIDLFPSIEPPVIAVVTSYPDAGPYEVENMVTRPVEEALSAVNNIKNLTSTSQRGSSIVVAEFEWGTNMDVVSLDVREQIDRMKDFLPDEADSPIYVKFDPGQMAVVQIALRGDLPAAELRHIADNLIGQFERLEGVASASVSGGEEREIKVILHPGLMQSYQVSLESVTQALRLGNLTQPAGVVVDGDREYVLRTTGEFSSIDEISNLRVTNNLGSTVRLRDIAEVVDGYKEATTLNRYNGQSTVMISIFKESSANTVQVAERVRQTVERLNGTLTADASMEVAVDTSEFIQASIDGVTQNAIYGALLAMIILFLFLRSVRTTLVVALAIPISVVATFILLYFSNTTINMVSLGGLALGIGMLVDNAIVVLENIFRHRESGKNVREAAYGGAEQVGMAITASTLTTVSVFLPIVFVSGIAAEIFRDMALTVTFSLLTSLVISLSLIPMLSSRMLGVATSVRDDRGWKWIRAFGNFLEGMQNAYSRGLRWTLRHRIGIVVAAIVIMIVSFSLLPRVGMEFMPQMDQGEISINIQMPKGTRLEDTDRIVRAFEEYLADLPSIDVVSSSVGGSGGMGPSTTSESASIGVRMVPLEEREISTEQVISQLREVARSFPEAEIQVQMTGMVMMSFGSPVQIELRSDDMDLLIDTAERLVELVEDIPGTAEVTHSAAEHQPEVQVRIDREKAASYGLTVGQVASHLRTAVDGSTVTRYRTGGREIDVTVRYAADWRYSPEDVANIVLPSRQGQLIPLKEVAELQVGGSPVAINRSERSRVVSVSGQVMGRDLSNVMRDIQAAMANFSMPPEVTVNYGGQNEQMMDSFAQLFMAALLGAALVYMILASLFESLWQPFIIMITLPFAMIGVVGGLVLTGSTFNIVAFVGVIMLAGIVVNNAIVFLDYVNQLRSSGMERNEALVEAGRTRLRPILMTSLTTILAMVPLAFGFGEGAEMQRSMAVVVMGGLLTSTILTLFMVPVFYTLLDGFINWLRRLANTISSRLLGGKAQQPTPGID